MIFYGEGSNPKKPLPSGALFNATCIRLSLDRLLPSRACLRFTEYHLLFFFVFAVNYRLWDITQPLAYRSLKIHCCPTSLFPLFAYLGQFLIPLSKYALLVAHKLVMGGDVADGTVEPMVIVISDKIFHDLPGVFK